MPTLTDIAGVKSPEKLDGISFLPTLLGEKGQKQHETMYWEFHEQNGRQAIRKGSWKLVKYNVLIPQKTTTELFDLSKDPGEENNLANKYPNIVKELSTLIAGSRIPSDVYKFQQQTVIQ